MTMFHLTPEALILHVAIAAVVLLLVQPGMPAGRAAVAVSDSLAEALAA